jgi:hypothetical protein
METGAKWPETRENLTDAAARKLAHWLLARMPGGSVVVFVAHPGNHAAFFCAKLEPVSILAPPAYGPESRAARIQGALLSAVFRNGDERSLCSDRESLERGAESVYQVAFAGTETRPWQY